MTDDLCARIKAEQLAAERYRYADLQGGSLVPKSEALNVARDSFIDGYLTARTITAEQVEAAAEALWNRSPFAEALEAGWDEWSRQNPNATELWEDDVRFTLTAAGLLIEGDDHE